MTPSPVVPVRPAEQLDGAGWEKDVAHYTELVTPFGWSLFGPAARDAVEAMGRDFGLMVAGLDQVSIGGEVYVRPIPAFGSPEPQGSAPPAIAIGLAARLVPALRRRMRTAKEAATADLASERLATWNERWRSEFDQRIRTLLAEDLADIDDRAMADHLERAASLLHDGHHVHFQLYMPYTLALYDLVVTCRELLRWDEPETMRLLVGHSPASVAGIRELDPLVDAIAERPGLADTLRARPTDPVGALATIDPGLATDLDRWLRSHGWRCTNYDPGSPAIVERPELITRLLLCEGPTSDDQVAAGAEAEARERLAETDVVRFGAALDRARRVYPVREENVALTDNIPCGILRRWVVEAGRRLAEAGRLARADDAVFCTADELARVLRGSEDELQPQAARRRAEMAWTRSHPGPAVVGPIDGPPDLRMLPKHGRRLNEAVMWGLQMEFPGETAGRSTGDELRGTPGAPGTYTGRVRVVRGEADFTSLLAGEVLVCPTTSPAWSILFAIAGALITDGGGPLAHSAIVAREHGLPAVVGTVDATARLVDGDLVTVDGTTGIVTRLNGR